MRAIVLAASLAAALAGPVFAAESLKPPKEHWSFSGLFGTFDRAQLQRGFQVYKEVCATCHAVHHLNYRHLAGIGLDEAQIKAIAAEAKVPDINDEGQPMERPGIAADKFARPFANERAARAVNNGAFPPDLSLIVKARAGGADHLYAILTGYTEPPANLRMGQGMNYNLYFPGGQIAMTAPLAAGQVTYSDGTPSTLPQLARDVSAFLAWAAEPELEVRKRMGVKVILFLLLLAGLTYAMKRHIWTRLH
jgi:ubiquinol-cytochrome c reductase cytochrome c1 subunit